MEPIREKVLKIEDLPSCIENILHLARNRGGISDLLHIMSIKSDIIDDTTSLSQNVVNAYN